MFLQSAGRQVINSALQFSPSDLSHHFPQPAFQSNQGQSGQSSKQRYKQELIQQIQQKKRLDQELKAKYQAEDLRRQQQFYQDLKKQKAPANVEVKQQLLLDPAKDFNRNFPIKSNFNPNENFQFEKAFHPPKYYHPDHQIQSFAYEPMFPENSSDFQKNHLQILNSKLSEVYNEIEKSKNALETLKEFENFKRKMKPASHETEDNRQLSEGDFSRFYYIPKTKPIQLARSGGRENHNDKYSMNRLTRIEEKAENRVKTEKREWRQKSKKADSQFEYEMEPRGKHFLGNREALDYQIESIMSKIEKAMEGQ